MLEHLRQKVIQALASVDRITLSTCGPAGIQAENIKCEAHGIKLYMIIPRASELLFNIENHPEVIITADEWQLKGNAVVLHTGQSPELQLKRLPEAEWGELVVVNPTRLNIQLKNSTQRYETVDINE